MRWSCSSSCCATRSTISGTSSSSTSLPRLPFFSRMYVHLALPQSSLSLTSDSRSRGQSSNPRAVSFPWPLAVPNILLSLSLSVIYIPLVLPFSVLGCVLIALYCNKISPLALLQKVYVMARTLLTVSPDDSTTHHARPTPRRTTLNVSCIFDSDVSPHTYLLS